VVGAGATGLAMTRSVRVHTSYALVLDCVLLVLTNMPVPSLADLIPSTNPENPNLAC
jgi:hypothetical protein